MEIPSEGEVVSADSTTAKVEETVKVEEPKTVPFDRFRQVNKEKNDIVKEFSAFRKEVRETMASLKKQDPVDYANMTAEQLEKRASDMAYERLKNEQQAEKEAESQKAIEAEEYIDNFFADLKDDGHDLKESDVNEILKLALDEFDNDLPKAFKAFKREQKAKLEVEKTKAEAKAKEGESISGKRGSEWNGVAKWPVRRWDDLHASAQKYFK